MVSPLNEGLGLPSGWAQAIAGDFRRKRSVTFNPAVAAEGDYELWSIPSHATGAPEIVTAHDIGSNKQYVAPGDVLISRINPRLNRSWVVGNKRDKVQIASTEWVVFPKSPAIEPRFFAALLSDSRIKNFLAANASGVGGSLTRVRPELFDSILVPIPPLIEQQRIIDRIEALFDEIDRGIESLRDAKRGIGLYRQSLLKSAFEGRLTADWRAKNPEKLESPEALLARIREEREKRDRIAIDDWKSAVAQWKANGKQQRRPSKPNQATKLLVTPEETALLPPIPPEWQYAKLATLGELARGRSRHRPRNDQRLFGGAYPFIQTGEVKAAGRSITEYRTTYSEMGLAQSKLWPEGTLCITIAANIAETAFLTFEACFPDSIVGFGAFKEAVIAAFVELFIKSARSKIDDFAPATAQKNINLTALETLVIPLCSHAEQAEVVRILNASLEVTEALDKEIEANLARADMLRQSILQRAFSGQLIAQDPSDEPASDLLARIRAERAKVPPKRAKELTEV